MIKKNTNLYVLPLSMFVIGILVGTAVSIWRADFLYRIIVCYLPAVHLQILQTGFPSGFIAYLGKLRMPVFLVMSVSIFSNFALVVFGGIAFAAGASVAVVIIAATMFSGITGILQALLLFGLHSLFYIFAYWALYELAGKRKGFKFGEQLGILVRIAAIWVAGIVIEGLLSPMIITNVLLKSAL